jgi:hypothetical protein
LTDRALLETHGTGRDTVNRWLVSHNHRAIRFSKYGTGMVLLNDRLPRGPWRQLCDRLGGNLVQERVEI